MNVLVVTVVHVAGDARIRHRQIPALLAAGHRVTYAAPHGDPVDDPVDGLRLVHVPRATGRDRLAPLRAARDVLRTIGPDHDLVLVHDPELVLAAAGLDLPPRVLDVHEDLAGSLTDKSWIPAGLRTPLSALVRATEGRLEDGWHLLLAETAYQARFDRLHPVVPNLPPLPADVAPAGSRRRVVHLGRVSRLRGAAELVEVGRQLSQHAITLDLIGPVDADVDAAVSDAHERGWLVRHGFVPNDRALPMVTGAIAGLALLHDHPNYRVSLPTKIVEYLAAGVPAITTPLPEALRVVETSGAGVVVPFGDVKRVVGQVLAWTEDPSRAEQLGNLGRRAAEARWSWESVAPAFVGQLEAWAAG